MNCGIGGSDPVFQFRLFKDKLLKYTPDIITVTINSTDINDIIIRGGFNRFLPDNKLRYNNPPWFEPIYAHSHIFRRVIHDILKFDWQFVSHSKREQIESNANAILINAIDSFYITCKEMNCDLLVVFQPIQSEVENNEEYNFNKAKSYCINKGIQIIDLREKLIKEEINPHKIYWQKDYHFNNYGYYCFAKNIFPELSELITKKLEQKN